MDYLLDNYFFRYIPFEVSPHMKAAITAKAFDVVRIADWWCKAQEPRKLVANHTSFFAVELVAFILCILTFCHAFRQRGRYLFTWIGILFFALISESRRFFAPQLDVIWHAQGMLTFFGMRTPLYLIVGVYHMAVYTAFVMSRRLHIPWWAEGPAAGLITATIDFPLLLMGTKLLWWQFHDSDSAVFDRVYSVPWILHCSGAVTVCSFIWALRLARHVLLPAAYNWKLFMREFICVILASTVGLVLSILQIDALFHLLHNILKVHSSIPTIAVLGTYATVVIIADRHNRNPEARPKAGEVRYWFDELACAVCIHFLFYVVLSLTADPKNIVAEGLHQPLGLCNVTESVTTVFGAKLKRQKYLCAFGHYSKEFDFHCLPTRKAPAQVGDGALEWYAICGTEFSNRFDYIFLIWISSTLSLTILYQVAARSGTTPTDRVPGKRNVVSGQARTPAAYAKWHQLFEEVEPFRRGSQDSKPEPVRPYSWGIPNVQSAVNRSGKPSTKDIPPHQQKSDEAEKSSSGGERETAFDESSQKRNRKPHSRVETAYIRTTANKSAPAYYSKPSKKGNGKSKLIEDSSSAYKEMLRSASRELSQQSSASVIPSSIAQSSLRSRQKK